MADTTQYRYSVAFKIDVRRLDNKMLDESENEMVKKMQIATEEAIAKVMTEYGNEASQSLGREFRAY